MKRSEVRSQRTGKKRRTIVLLSILLCALGATLLIAATVGYTEGWDTFGDISDWQRTSSVITLLNTEQDLRIRFSPQAGPPVQQEATAYADATSSGGSFVGNYEDDGVTMVSFDFLADDQIPSAAYLQFYSATGDRTWHILLPSPTVGVVESYTVPLTYKVVFDGLPFEWQADTGGLETEFAADLQDITWIGVYVRRHGSTLAQVYHVDNFVLGGTPIPDPRDIDTDNDKYTDWEEAIAGTDPEDPTSYLQLNVTARDLGARGVLLHWNSVAGREYRVLRSRSLMTGTNSFVTQYSEIDATPPRNEQSDGDEPENGTFFYMLKVKKK